MKKNILIGDSQTHYLAKSLKETIHSIDYFKDSYFEDRTMTKMVNREYTNIQYKFSILDNNLDFSIYAFPGKSAYHLDYNKQEILNNTNHEDSIVFVWMGWIDINSWLTEYRNPDKVVNNYLNNAIKYFNKNKLVFITPVPPPLVIDRDFGHTKAKLSGDDEIDLNFIKESFFERRKYYDLFKYELNKQCKTHNLTYVNLKNIVSSDLYNGKMMYDSYHWQPEGYHQVIDFMYNYD